MLSGAFFICKKMVLNIVLRSTRYFPVVHDGDTKLVQNAKMQSVLVLIATDNVVIR
jgi:hypothetical protein